MLALVLGDEQPSDLPVHGPRDPDLSGRRRALHPRGDVGRFAIDLACGVRPRPARCRARCGAASSGAPVAALRALRSASASWIASAARTARSPFGRVEPDRAERRLQLGEPLFARHFGAAEPGAAPFRGVGAGERRPRAETLAGGIAQPPARGPLGVGARERPHPAAGARVRGSALGRSDLARRAAGAGRARRAGAAADLSDHAARIPPALEVALAPRRHLAGAARRRRGRAHGRRDRNRSMRCRRT